MFAIGEQVADVKTRRREALMRRSFALAVLVSGVLLVPAVAPAGFSLRPTLIDGASWRHADRGRFSATRRSVRAGGSGANRRAPRCLAPGGGTVAASPQTNRQFTS